MMFEKKMVGSVACGFALLGGFSACSTGDGSVAAVADVAPEAPAAVEQGSEFTVVPAGEAGTGLGVARWEANGDAVYGLQDNGEIVAEFHSTDRGLESVLPEAGLLTASGASFPELTQRYYDAFSADAQAVLPAGAAASAAVVPSALVFFDCYANLATCFVDRDLIFRQTGIICVCQPPDGDQFCGRSLVDLECNL